MRVVLCLYVVDCLELLRQSKTKSDEEGKCLSPAVAESLSIYTSITKKEPFVELRSNISSRRLFAIAIYESQAPLLCMCYTSSSCLLSAQFGLFLVLSRCQLIHPFIHIYYMNSAFVAVKRRIYEARLINIWMWPHTAD